MAYQSARSLAEDLEAHLKSRRSSVIDVLRSAWPWGREVRAGRWQSIDIAKAFAEGTASYEDLEYAQAREAFRAASGLDPRNPVLLAWVSRTAQLVKGEDEATETADRAVSLLMSRTPRVDALFVRAVAAEARRDAAAAENFYRELTRERPDDPTWAMELGGISRSPGEKRRCSVRVSHRPEHKRSAVASAVGVVPAVQSFPSQ